MGKVPMSYTVEQATRDVAQLYINRFENEKFTLKQELKMFREIVNNDWPIDKMNRWLGFAQAGLIEKGFCSVDQERHITRPYFHRAYQDQGIDIPASVKV